MQALIFPSRIKLHLIESLPKGIVQSIADLNEPLSIKQIKVKQTHINDTNGTALIRIKGSYYGMFLERESFSTGDDQEPESITLNVVNMIDYDKRRLEFDNLNNPIGEKEARWQVGWPAPFVVPDWKSPKQILIQELRRINSTVHPKKIQLLASEISDGKNTLAFTARIDDTDIYLQYANMSHDDEWHIHGKTVYALNKGDIIEIPADQNLDEMPF